MTWGVWDKHTPKTTSTEYKRRASCPVPADGRGAVLHRQARAARGAREGRGRGRHGANKGGRGKAAQGTCLPERAGRAECMQGARMPLRVFWILNWFLCASWDPTFFVLCCRWGAARSRWRTWKSSRPPPSSLTSWARTRCGARHPQWRYSRGWSSWHPSGVWRSWLPAKLTGTTVLLSLRARRLRHATRFRTYLSCCCTAQV